jgi:prepilin-type processing-associated H-X9-DG protein
MKLAPQPRAPILIEIPQAPWGQIPISLNCVGIRAQAQDGSAVPIVQVNFAFPDGHVQGVPLTEDFANWLINQMKEKLMELKGGIVIPKLNGGKGV